MRLFIALLSVLVFQAFADDALIYGKWNQNAAMPSSGGSGTVTNFNDLIFQWQTSGSGTATASTIATPSWTPSPNALEIAVVCSTKATAADTPNAPTGNGLTWVLVTNCPYGSSSTNMISIFRAQGASPSAGATTVTWPASQTSQIITITEVQGADATAANGANAIVNSYTNGNTTATANPTIAYTIPAAVQTNAIFWAVADNVNSATGRTANTNWVLVHTDTHGTRLQAVASMFQSKAISVSAATETASSRVWGGCAIEIKPSLISNPNTQPTLVQYVACNGDNLIGSGVYFTNIWFSLPNPTLSGNLLSLYCEFNYGTTCTVTDDKGNQWTQGASFDDSAGSIGFPVSSRFFYATNIASGTVRIELSFGVNTNCAFIHMDCGEYAHIRLNQPVDVSAASEPVLNAGVLMDSGSMTTTADQDLLILNGSSYHGGFTGVNMPGGFTDDGMRFLGLQNNDGFASAYGVQAKAAAIDPFMVAWDTVGATWLSHAISYKSGSGGTLPSTNSIRIIREVQYLCIASGVTTDNLYWPCDGSLQVMTTAAQNQLGWITNVTSVYIGNVWKKLAATLTTSSQIVMTTNALTRFSPPDTLVINHKNNPNMTFMYDIANASAFPIDTSAEALVGPLAANSDFNSVPNMTPTVANGLAIDACGFDTGPPYKMSSAATAGIIFDSPYYFRMQDGTTFTKGDGYAHFFYPSTSQVSFGFSTSNNATASATASGVLLFHK